MSEYQTTLKPGQIRFHKWCEPPLEAGDYTVKVAQEVQELKGDPTSEGKYGSNFSFSVAGPRFSLDPSEIYAVYPPQGQIGDFANTLPHIVFTRRTLPWERSIRPGPRAESDQLPWMALLVFCAADFEKNEFPEIAVRKAGELINPSEDKDFIGPKLQLERYESNEELCNTIDLPWDLFQDVAPSMADLAFLAHVREVNTDHKETISFLADGWFSVVLANRFPQPQIEETKLPVENRAYLVSLEGMDDYVPGDKPAAEGKNKKKTVRLAMLSSWSFNCSETFTFKDAIDKLKTGLLRVPWQENLKSMDPATKSHVQRALMLGYTALNHSTRLGEKTVSWYRGPLVPLYISKETKYKFLPAADAAMRYVPRDGMMDVTYAAAYQLGRLLALQDRHFATTFYAYRNGVRRQINDMLGVKQVQSALGLDKQPGKENELMNEYLNEYLQTLQVGPDGAKSGKEWVAAEKFDIIKRGDDKELPPTIDFDLTIPSSICQWLARLLLLYRVPFSYLVPDERMLPSEGMSFFYLDPGWLKCLLEGACSVGRSSSHDELVDEYLRDNFLKLAFDESQKVRTKTKEQDDDASKTLNLSDVPQNDWITLTGFLMRSPVVKGWQGLEMHAWADSGENAKQELKPLRIDRLAPDIMLCIFKGTVNRIELKQPPEGMHFGAAPDRKGGFNKEHLRRLDNGNPGEQLDKPSICIPLRDNGKKRVVAVSKLAQILKKVLKLGSKADFTSADFGVEMVESPGRAIFDFNPKRGQLKK